MLQHHAYRSLPNLRGVSRQLVHDPILSKNRVSGKPGAVQFRFRRDGKPPRRVRLGKPGAVKADQARAAAIAFLAREKGGGKPLPPPPSGPTLSKLAAEYVERRSPAWKPSTVKATLSYLHSAILPALGRLHRARRCRALLPRVRAQKAGRCEPLSRDTAHHVRLCRRVGSSARGCRKPLHRHRPLPPSAARTAAWDGRSGEARRDPAPARRHMAPPDRGGAADSADRMQARRDTPLALVRGQAGPARSD